MTTVPTPNRLSTAKGEESRFVQDRLRFYLLVAL